MNENFTWVPFYKELAKIILGYKNKQDELVAAYKNVFVQLNSKFPNIHVVQEINKIDPFTFFSHFNVDNKNVATRLSIIEQIKKDFNVQANMPSDLNGITCSPWAYANFSVGETAKEYEDTCSIFWDLYEIALTTTLSTKNEEDAFIQAFDKALTVKYTRFVKLTTGLLWCAPDLFFALDKYSVQRVTQILRQSSLTQSDQEDLIQKLNNNRGGIKGKDYLELRKVLMDSFKATTAQQKSFVEISYIEDFVLNAGEKKSNNLEEFKKYLEATELNNSSEYRNSIISLLNSLQKRLGIDLHQEYETDKCSALQNEINKDDFASSHQYNQSTVNNIKTYLSKFIKYKEQQAVDSSKECKSQHNNKLKYPLNQILYGPPGTGKTYHTIDKAVKLIKPDFAGDHKQAKEEYKKYKANGQIEFVTFHQSYGYEEFIEGIKPIIVGKDDTRKVVYDIIPGIFKAFCNEAEKDENKNKNYVFIIDEINRGNVSKIFGELITLIEESKRIGADEEMQVKLPYSGELFGVPDNVYILGTMNTADRSLVQLDAALRRRFRFEEMMPNPKLLGVVDNVDLNKLLTAINDRICALIDREHQIGHSYFMNVKTIGDLKDTFKYEIIPLLQEYFYEDYENILKVLNYQLIEVDEVDKKKVADVDYKAYKINVDSATAKEFRAIYSETSEEKSAVAETSEVEGEAAASNEEK